MELRYLRNLTTTVVIIIILSFIPGCVYYNTFYNAEKAFNRAEKGRKSSKRHVRSLGGDYKIAIEKSLKVIENYPNTKWYDDALYILGVSYFYTGQYIKAERRLRELLVNYPESKYIDESNLYLAKSKLLDNEIEDAIILFEDIFQKDYDKKFKAEAAMAIGEYHFDNENYKKAEPYFFEIRDSLGTDDEALKVQIYIADGNYNQFKFSSALGAYLQILGMEPDKNQKYHALFRSADCSYQLQRIDDGMDYINSLMKEELYFDSLSVLKLKLAEGYELDEDVQAAEKIYEDVIDEEIDKRSSAKASYKLGLIYQFDYDDLVKAKEYYDNVGKISRGAEDAKDALQRSSDIGKLEIFAHTIEIDSTTTQSEIDAAALTQYYLSELYWFKLNKPDTAILEMQYLIDSFPTAYDVPRAMIALSQMYRDFKQDTAIADSILNEALIKHPNSDFAPDALEVLGLLGTAADSGYALKNIHKAEEFFDREEIDSARYYYQYVVDNYEESDFYLQARFALIWLTETFESPGDSSVYFAYAEFLDSFPDSDWAREARKKTSASSHKSSRPSVQDTIQEIKDEPWGDQFKLDSEEKEKSGEYIDPLSGIYISIDGDSIYNVHKDVKPSRFTEEFEFPVEAYTVDWRQYDFYFQIKLDFVGKVEDYRLMNPTLIEELNIRIERYIAGAEFDVSAMPLDQQGKWQVYKYRFTKPREFDR